MGNCCRRESSTLVAAGDDRRFPPLKKNGSRKHSDDGAPNTSYGGYQRLRTESGTSSSSFSSSSSRFSEGGSLGEVKIKMTKKELQELIGWLNMADSSFDQIMARWVNVVSNRGDDNDGGGNGGPAVQLRQSSWRPSLQSIPEII